MLRYNPRVIKEKASIVAVFTLTILMFLPLAHIIFTILSRGLPVIMKGGLKFLTGTLDEGGIGPAIIGTGLLIVVSSLIGLPVAFIVGVYSYEYPNSVLGKATRALLQIMMEFPTILVGVFVMGILVIPMKSYSALAGGLALAIILMPYVAIYTQESLRQIPFTYREAAFSLGLPKWKVILRILVPLARKGILTGVLIGISKVAGETAPLLFTIGGMYQTYPQGITKPVGALPLLIYTLIQSPAKEHHEIAWGASAVLLLIFLALFLPIRLSLKEVKI
ncbi:phosphate ABC transporter permease PstA [Pyrococcus abyssi]|uniref:Phosphate transport system permease protein PstA n=1 Tax=Pyrococcus abyssi (strain GE5 / Orsay) TaxID=272844 RepID=Q9UZU8_PYRAB|nr:phosphate ABC transporter permease PstA [Pyrococcus abyssi]CAB49958.1 pstA phosphate ABC transporter, permease protein [Pyrococcus abyssi GE5]CCE70457.1 TPA: phosphate ABC transporter, permease protein [Pyrococcus abyssi GE5]